MIGLPAHYSDQLALKLDCVKELPTKQLRQRGSLPTTVARALSVELKRIEKNRKKIRFYFAPGKPQPSVEISRYRSQ